MGKNHEIEYTQKVLNIYKKKITFSFHAFNIGNMTKKDSTPLFLPCTPKGIIHLLKSTGNNYKGKPCCGCITGLNFKHKQVQPFRGKGPLLLEEAISWYGLCKIGTT